CKFRFVSNAPSPPSRRLAGAVTSGLLIRWSQHIYLISLSFIECVACVLHRSPPPRPVQAGVIWDRVTLIAGTVGALIACSRGCGRRVGGDRGDPGTSTPSSPLSLCRR